MDAAERLLYGLRSGACPRSPTPLPRCNVCEAPNSHSISNHAYAKGTVPRPSPAHAPPMPCLCTAYAPPMPHPRPAHVPPTPRPCPAYTIAWPPRQVLATCPGCQSAHLIADNLNWIEDDFRNLEEQQYGQTQSFSSARARLLRHHRTRLPALGGVDTPRGRMATGCPATTAAARVSHLQNRRPRRHLVSRSSWSVAAHR